MNEILKGIQKVPFKGNTKDVSNFLYGTKSCDFLISCIFLHQEKALKMADSRIYLAVLAFSWKILVFISSHNFHKTADEMLIHLGGCEGVINKQHMKPILCIIRGNRGPFEG